jgi:hypothetical protein
MQCSNPARRVLADPYREAEKVADRLTAVFVFGGIAIGLGILGAWGYVVVHFVVKFW